MTREQEIIAIVERHIVGCDPRLTLAGNLCDSLMAAGIQADVEDLVGNEVPMDWLIQNTVSEWAAKAALL